MKSQFLKLHLGDFVKASIMTAGGFIVTSVSQVVQSGNLNTPDLLTAAKAGAIMGAVYVAKNLFTNSKDEFAKPEPTKTL